MLGFVPTNSTINIIKAGSLDDWGELTDGETITVPAFVTTNSDNKTIPVSTGNEVVYNASALVFEPILIHETDTITWTDTLGQTHSGQPLSVSVRTDLGGAYTYTKVVI